MRRYLLLCIATLSAGCLDSLDKTNIKCTTKEHCPSGLVCVSGICKQGTAAVDSGGRDMPVADATFDQASIDVGAGGSFGVDAGEGGSFSVDAPAATGGSGGVSGIDAVSSGGAGGTAGDFFDAPLVDMSPDVPIVDAPGSCGTDKDCPTQEPLCLGNRCSKCATDNDCVGRSGPACATSGLCVACTASSYCKGAAATCDTTTNQCVGCTKRSDCSGACQTCSAGVCVAVANGDDPSFCAGTCDATGTCKSKQGQTCMSVPGGCIGSTTCSPDGICCDKACKESCMACDLSGYEGLCTAVQAGSPHGNRASCGADATCGGICAGRSDGQCAYPTKVCGPVATCSGTDKVLAQSTCTNGVCPAQTSTTCTSGFACGGGMCNTTCTSSADCQANFFCSGGTCHSDVVGVGLAVSRTCVVLKDGRVMCWGSGYLGDNANHGSTGTPIQVANITDATQVRTTGFAGSSCALRASGTVFCWGKGNYGQLGNGPQPSQSSYFSLIPVQVVTSNGTPLTGVTALSAGWDLFCATTASATYCWGSNSGGTVGPEATYGASIVSATALPSCGPYQALAMGQYFQAGWKGSAGLEPWGSFNDDGEVKSPPTSGQAYSSCTGQYTTLPEAISEVVAGAWHICVLAADKAVRCWGLNSSAQLGSGDTASPLAIPGARIPSFTATHLTAGRKFNCAQTSDQRNVACWGTNSSLQVSPDTTVPYYSSPTTVALSLPEGLTVSTVESSSEASHVCVIISDGSLMCWGNNAELESGTGATGSQSTPAFVKANW